jgi:galactokinase/galacturonokinase
VDHQHGPVLGMAIDVGTRLAFAPADDGRCRLVSRGFEPAAEFDVTAPEAGAGEGWTRYPRAAAWALRERLPGRARGVRARLAGDLPGGGLSSSASLLLACLEALARVNGIPLTAGERVALALRAENDFVGLRSGILDPASIVGSERGRLTAIDPATRTWRTLAPGSEAPPVRVLVAYSGRTRHLTATGFNRRVEECAEAARTLARQAGLPPTERLGDLPEAALEDGLGRLPPLLARRARHFATERRRVRAGEADWRAGDLAAFGRRMRESCRSSIVDFETGSEDLVRLHDILCETPGVLGSRFSGAGFAGCVVGLVEAGRAESARERVAQVWACARPALADAARVFLADSADGLHTA